MISQSKSTANQTSTVKVMQFSDLLLKGTFYCPWQLLCLGSKNTLLYKHIITLCYLSVNRMAARSSHGFHLFFKHALCSQVKGFTPHGLLVYRPCLPPDTPIIFIAVVKVAAGSIRS